MWIVRLALSRPYTVAVLAFLMLYMGVLSMSRMIVDIFPAISIPVVVVVWNCPGLSPEDMEPRVVIPGLSTPAPFGGKFRQIMVDIDPKALAARSLSPADVVSALQSSDVILPAGTARIGSLEYNVLTNSSPPSVEAFNAIPIKVVGTAPVYLGDVAKVSDSYAVQTNIVHVNGRRAAYLAILKHADASTIASPAPCVEI